MEEMYGWGSVSVGKDEEVQYSGRSPLNEALQQAIALDQESPKLQHDYGRNSVWPELRAYYPPEARNGTQPGDAIPKIPVPIVRKLEPQQCQRGTAPEREKDVPVTRYNAPGQGIKYDSGKPQWHLVPLQYFEGMVRVMEKGAAKYSAHNWRSGMPHSQVYNALIRHLTAHQAGENNDPETNLPHIDHALCCLMFLKMNIVDYPEKDDRYVASK